MAVNGPTKYKYSDEQVTEAVRNAESVTEVMRLLGVKQAGGNWTHINNRIKRLELDTSHFVRPSGFGGRNKKTPEELFVVYPVGSRRVPGSQLRRALIESNVPYECAGTCEVGGTWNGTYLILQVDHINGDALDCRFENLRFLCPNCHTQTATYAGKSRLRWCECGRPKQRISQSCQECARKRTRGEFRPNRYKIEWPEIGVLLAIVEEHKGNISAVGRVLGVSEAAVRRHIRTRSK